MSEQVMLWVIIALIGILVGGAGGATILRGVTKRVLPDTTAETAATLANSNAVIAATVAQTATSVAAALQMEISERLGRIETRIDTSNESIHKLEIAVSGFMASCPAKHESIDGRLKSLERSKC